MVSYNVLLKQFVQIFQSTILVACFAGFIFQVVEFISVYYQYQTSVEIKIEPADKLLLPSVTFCPQEKINVTHWCIIKPDECRKDLTLLNEETVAETLSRRYLIGSKDAGFQLNSVLVKCSVAGSDNCHPIYTNYTSAFGNCFTINIDRMSTAVTRNSSTISRSRRVNGIYMHFYLYLDQNISFSRTYGAVITLSSPDSVPNLVNALYNLENGKEYTFFVSQSISHLLPPPYATNCTDYDKMGRTSFRSGLLTQQNYAGKLKIDNSVPIKKVKSVAPGKCHAPFGGGLSPALCLLNEQLKFMETCFAECVANFTLKMCGCIHSSYPYSYEHFGSNHICLFGNQTGVCTTKNLESEKVNAKLYCDDKCHSPCRKVTYEVTPFQQPIIASGTVDEKSTQQLYGNFLNKPVSLEYIKSSGIKVNFMFKNKNLMVYQHYPRYQDVELFSYIGGYIGMWLGISLANVLEVIIKFINKIQNWYLNLKNQSLNIIKPIQQAEVATNMIEK